MINLLKETEYALRQHIKSSKAIKYICNAEGYIKIADFFTQAWKTNYDNRSGRMVIDPTIKLVGGNWWLERKQEGDLEGWVFRRRPFKPGLQVQALDLTLYNDRGEKFDHMESEIIEAKELEYEPI